jgi:hypothetical protein
MTALKQIALSLKDAFALLTQGRYIERDAATGTVTFEEWWKDGKRDRTDGPALIERDAVTGTVIALTGEAAPCAIR